MPKDNFFASLPNRGEVRISGPDRTSFLQGLITNDVEKLEPGALLYACFLTPQGKFLHDFFIREEEDTLILDCEGGARAQDLGTRLSRYKLRADVEIDVNEDVEVYSLLPSPRKRGPHSHTSGSDQIPARGGDDVLFYKDPRHADLGSRTYKKPENLTEKPFEEWDRLRISLCFPDGSRDLIPEKSTLAEANMDGLNAIDYDKGCYVGQELTARMHYRSLGKKHLAVVDPNALPEGAELRSSCGDIALALIRP